MDLPARFGKYELVELLGTGGMATVYKAVLSGLGGFRKHVAIKQMLPHVSQDEMAVQLLFNEARLGGLLRHKNLVEVYEFDRVDDTYYLAIEYVDGFTLDQVVKRVPRNGPIPQRAAANIAMQVCKGLEYAHTATDDQGQPMNLVHRDLKPANLMIQRDGVVKIADFGIALAATNVVRTATGLIRGTPAYMSPEQTIGDKKAGFDHRSDLFALGSILGEALLGTRMFDDEQMLPLLNRISRADVDEPLQRLEQRAPAFVPVLRRALARDPADRYADAGEMGRDIRSLYDSLPPAEERLGVWLGDWMEFIPDRLTSLSTDSVVWTPPGSGDPEASATTPPAELPIPPSAPAEDDEPTAAPAPSRPAPPAAPRSERARPVERPLRPARSRAAAPGAGPRVVSVHSGRHAAVGGEAPVGKRRRKRSGEWVALAFMATLIGGLTYVYLTGWNPFAPGEGDEDGATGTVEPEDGEDGSAGQPGGGGTSGGQGTASRRPVEAEKQPAASPQPAEEGEAVTAADEGEVAGDRGAGAADAASDESGSDRIELLITRSAKLRRCQRKYEAQLDTAGSVTVEFQIQPGGAVDGARVTRPAGADPDLVTCLVEGVGKLKLEGLEFTEPASHTHTFHGSP